nr:endonuclease [uncultured Desulfobulbus sp.]
MSKSPLRLIIASLSLILFFVSGVFAGNTTIDSFSNAKKILQYQIYPDHRITVYCGAEFDAKKNVSLPPGFVTTKHVKRSEMVEWEHIVPAENFGQTFTEWRDGDPGCVDSKGKSFKGRNCARKMNKEFRYMEADLYNLYPAIGAVNASRSNYNFTMIPGSQSSFGSCDMRIEGSKAQPPEAARGRIARTYLYMDDAYSRYKMSSQQRKLMQAWDKMYPVSAWECERASRIEQVQGNENRFVADHCR